MKKIFIIALLLSVCSLFVFAEDVMSSKFTKALFSCSPYSESGSLNTEGMNVTSNIRILGMKDGKCVYTESVSVAENNLTITCRFTKTQLEELAKVTSAYEVVQQYTGEKIDTSSYSAVENNPVVKLWAKYLQDNSVCSVN